jgi:hypothetical protein
VVRVVLGLFCFAGFVGRRVSNTPMTDHYVQLPIQLIVFEQPPNCSNAATVRFCKVRLLEEVTRTGNPPGGQGRTPFDQSPKVSSIAQPWGKFLHVKSAAGLPAITRPLTTAPWL